MTDAGNRSRILDAARVFGSRREEAFASWDPISSSWREVDDRAARERLAAGGPGPEFTGGWTQFGVTSTGTAMGLATSGHESLGRCRRTWPTPKVTTNRTSRRSMTRDGHWSAPGLEQAVELSEGILPREVRALGEIKSPAARALWPSGSSRRSWGTPRASAGMTSRLRDPDHIQTADSRLEDQVALAEGRAGGWLNPEWVEWLMGFPRGWTRRPSGDSDRGAR
ncbi:MAG: hypothetical protein J0H06_12875 [Actinobacteria bacterium]|nr:hypothetical protein [Actinomycetota bacterium]